MKPGIVFIAESLWERPAKLAWGLRQKGQSVMLLHVNELTFDAGQYFDYCIQCSSPSECLEIAHRISPDVIHLFSFSVDNTSLLVLSHLKSKIVYDYKDIFENLIADPSDQNLWDGQRILLEKSTGVCCRDKQYVNYCRVNNVEMNQKTLILPDYCWGREHVRLEKCPDNEVHVVIIGTFIPEDAYPCFSSHGYSMIAEQFLEKGIHFHIYPGQWVSNVWSMQGGRGIYDDLSARHENLHIHENLPLEKLISEISKYDFGLLLYQGDIFNIAENFTINNHYEYGCSTRVFDYVEAGLNVLVSNSLTYQASILREFDFGVNVGKDFFDGDFLRLLTDMRSSSKERSRLIKAKKEMSICNYAGELADFYNSL